MNAQEKTLKVGTIYTLRNGLKTSPLKLSGNGTNYKFSAEVQEEEHETPSILSWKANGKYLTDFNEHPKDIILEKTLNEIIKSAGIETIRTDEKYSTVQLYHEGKTILRGNAETVYTRVIEAFGIDLKTFE